MPPLLGRTLTNFCSIETVYRRTAMKPPPFWLPPVLRFLDWLWPVKFKPCVFYNDDMKMTEIILEDTSIVWCPWGPYKGHAVDCGYSHDGRLVGIKIWDDVRERPQRVT